MRRLAVSLLCLATLVLLPRTARAEDDAAARAVFDKLLAAVDSKDYDAFLADADDTVKAAITQTQFDAVSDLMASRGSHDVTFLGELNQHGFEVYLYRLRYHDGDVLGTMALKDGKVFGILFK